MFELSFGTEKNKRVIGTYNTREEAAAEMVHQLKDRGIEPYCYSYSGNDDDQMIDYGSWGSFFFIRKVED